MKTKSTILQNATDFFRDDVTVMVGGPIEIGIPSRLVETLLESDVRDLILITNDTMFAGIGVDPLIIDGRVRKTIASHIDINPKTGRRMIPGKMDVILML